MIPIKFQPKEKMPETLLDELEWDDYGKLSFKVLTFQNKDSQNESLQKINT